MLKVNIATSSTCKVSYLCLPEKTRWLLTEFQCPGCSAPNQEILLGLLEDASYAHPLHHPSIVPCALPLVFISEITKLAPRMGAGSRKVASEGSLAGLSGQRGLQTQLHIGIGFLFSMLNSPPLRGWGRGVT